MPLPVATESELVILTKSATCAGANPYGGLSYFSGKSRDNCPVSKENLTPGRKKEVFLLPQNDSLWNNINGSSRNHVFDKQSCNTDSQSAECWTEHSAPHNDSKDMARLPISPADFPCRTIQVSQRQKRKNSFLPTQGIANSTRDLKIELCLLKIWHRGCAEQDLKTEMMAGNFSLQSRGWFSTSICRQNQQPHRAHGVPDWDELTAQNSLSFSLYFHMTIANSPDSYQSTILGSVFHCIKKFQSKNKDSVTKK